MNMKQYIDKRTQGDVARRLATLLGRIVAAPGLHARMLNTLARLEYVGVRKMLKSRRAERLDLGGLEHILDEAVHALRLKRAALAVAGDDVGVRTFAASDTLAGDAGESYLQALDRAAEQTLADLPEADRAEANYLLTSAAIEVRAQAFYPIYQRCLEDAGSRVSVAAILRDEERHLADMAARLDVGVPHWRPRLEAVLAREADLFVGFLDALERSF
jgi:hypothetical protein